MIFKVLYQDLQNEAPVRERTKSIYVEAETVREVRAKLKDRQYNIEFIQPLDPAHLTYEKQADNFVVENV